MLERKLCGVDRFPCFDDVGVRLGGQLAGFLLDEDLEAVAKAMSTARNAAVSYG